MWHRLESLSNCRSSPESLHYPHPAFSERYQKAGLNSTLSTIANMFDKVTVLILLFFLVSSYFGHQLLHRVIKTPAQYTNPGVANVQSR
jgi:hypothetical protein